MSERYWIPNPQGHRRYWNEEHVPHDGEMSELFGQPAVNIVMTAPEDTFICDVCNADIPLFKEDGHPLSVPCDGSYAYCPSCSFETLSAAERAQVAKGGNWIHIWSDAFCGCPPCTEFMEDLSEKIKAHASKARN